MRGPGKEIWKEVGSRVDRPDIWASEVADYAFCARSWWLKRVRRVKAESESLQLGTAAHEAAGQRVASAVQVDRTVKRLLWVLVALALGLLLMLAGCAMVQHPPDSWLYHDVGPPPNYLPQALGEYRDAVGYHRWLHDRTTVYGWPGGGRR